MLWREFIHNLLETDDPYLFGAARAAAKDLGVDFYEKPLPESPVPYGIFDKILPANYRPIGEDAFGRLCYCADSGWVYPKKNAVLGDFDRSEETILQKNLFKGIFGSLRYDNERFLSWKAEKDAATIERLRSQVSSFQEQVKILRDILRQTP